MDNFNTTELPLSLSTKFIPQIFSQILECFRSPFIIEEDIRSIIEKLYYLGTYSDIIAISDLLQDFMLCSKEEESNRYKSLDINIHFIEKLGIPFAYNLFTEKFVALFKKHKHTNGFSLDKLITAALNKLMVELDLQMLREVLPHFDNFYQLAEEDSKYKEIFESKVKKSQPTNYLDSYFSEICKLIYNFKIESNQQFLNDLIPKLKADLEGNRHFINMKFFSRIHQGFLAHLNARLENILVAQISKARVEANPFERILRQEVFYFDEPLPKETPQMKYFELFPYQYRLTPPQKQKLISLLQNLAIEARGLILGCVSNNTIRGISLNKVQQEILHDEIEKTLNLLNNQALQKALAVSFHEVKTESTFSFESPHRLVFKIVFSGIDDMQRCQFPGTELIIPELNLVKRTYSCAWHPDWSIDAEKIKFFAERDREDMKEGEEKRFTLTATTSNKSEKIEVFEKSPSVSPILSNTAPLKPLTLSPQKSADKEPISHEKDESKQNGKAAVEVKTHEPEIPSAWLQKIPTKKSSDASKVNIIHSCFDVFPV